MARQETFSSRWGLIVAGLGMAVGTGNMWRFPRIAAQNGGAAFLIPWLIFLVTWSLPLLIAEFGIGRGARRGVVGAFADLIGRRYAWMGGFIAVTSVMILFYYSVVTGWTLKYMLAALAGQLDASGAEQYWTDYSSSIWQPLGFHAISVLIGGLIISRGVVAGIERANKVLIPMLLGLLIVAVLRSVTLPGAGRGLGFLFNPDLSLLGSYRTWLEALTQSAWSTGAGWGLILTYAIYMRPDEDVVVNATAIGLGNNTASVLAGMAVVPTAFAILSESQALEAMAAGNTGLTFIWIPQLFGRMPGGGVFLPLFFMALFCAALSSLIAMIELATRILMDAGMVRRRAVGWVIGATIVGGAPSAVSLTVFENQDWVWGLALMISGLFIALGATRFGVRRFREELVNVTGNELNLGRGYEWVLTYLVPIEFAAMFAWWIYQAVAVIDPSGWWNPLRTLSLGTCLLQWGLALVLLVAFNRRIAAASLRGAADTAR
ncbi:MAG: sodium-dependent transporter [Acidobacteria bacterium]|jgi:NSS family neurotransmitter:Na+ symporter|nr:sodium-dependent transporter [Acidobacteriota bacterium]HJN45686.1 sodium-dependent transporter [Vicinamibacterales bacterium]|tara:strand:+ start:291 stop:1760 length:1470 start_codon:yes stop_codon:yes gene_type:complete